jgi:phage protein D
MTGSDIADASVHVNRTPLPPAAWADLRSITVQEDLDAMSMFTMELYNWDERTLRFTWSDSSVLAVGNEVRIALGYVDALEPVMIGEITSLEPRFAREEQPLVTVRGYDHRHRLARGRKTRAFQKMSDSAIADQVAREAGLPAEVTDSGAAVPHVLQSNQSDWDFLSERARLIGYEVFVRDKVLYFRPPRQAAAAAVTLRIGQDISDFSPRLSAQEQIGEVAVRGWDVKGKKPIVGRARAGQETTARGGGASGPRAARQVFGASSVASVDLPVRSVAEADRIARGRLNDLALDYIQGDVVAEGRPQVRAGMVVAIEGAGKRFSGSYYVTSVTHSLTADDGYRTTFSVQRNAA